jgi:hypothetical protein
METKSKEAIGKNRCINLKNISGLKVKKYSLTQKLKYMQKVFN